MARKAVTICALIKSAAGSAPLLLSSADRRAQETDKQLKTLELSLVSRVPLTGCEEEIKQANKRSYDLPANRKGTYMTQRVKFAFLALLAAGAALFAPAARADEWDKLTVMTFNEPVEIPGKVLPAGTYVFKLFDSQSDRSIVQIFTEDQKHLVATIMAIPDYREEPASKTVVTFDERPSGSPEALHSWFYPGDNYGVEFVYKKSERQYVARSEEPAMTPVPLPAAPVLQEADAVPTVPVVMREEEVVTIAEPAPATAASAETAPASLPETLPQTAGNFAILPLLGVVLLSSGFAAIRFGTRQA